MRRDAAMTVADDLGWSPVSAEHPCPVCGAPTGCATAPFRGGLAVDCRNVVSAWPMVDGGWLHRLPPDPPFDDRRDRAHGATCAFPVPAGGDVGTGDRVDASRADLARVAPTGETVLGAFATRELAERAIDALVAAGFHPDRLSALGRHGGSTDPARRPAADEAPATGAGIGAALGGFGAIALDLVAATIPGVGPVVAVGPFSEALSAALGGGFVGGLVGFLTAHGASERDAARYAERLSSGAYVVAVHTDDGARAEAILARSGAEAPIRHVPD
jgi:hypothetical protein